MNDKTVVKKPVPIAEMLEKVGDFELINKSEWLTYLTISGKVVILNHADKPLQASKDTMIDPANQEFLKEIYDDSPTYKQLIKAPSGYKAQWSSFENI